MSIRTLVVGFGSIGNSVLRAIAQPQYNGKLSGALLVRSAWLQDAEKADTIRTLKSQGIELVTGDGDESIDTLSPKLQGFHTVLSTVGGSGFVGTQLNLLAASERAGVKRFIPSEFSVDSNAGGGNNGLSRLYKDKHQIRDAIEASGLDYLYIIPNLRTELVVGGFGGVDLAGGSIVAPYTFDSRVSVTSVEDTGKLTAAVLLHGPSKTTVRFSSDTATYKQIADLAEQATGKQFKRTVRSPAEIRAGIDEALKGGKSKMGEAVKLEMAQFIGDGKGASWDAAEDWNLQQSKPIKTQSVSEYSKQQVSKL